MSSDARKTQPRASGVGCSLLHLPRPGSGRGWLAPQAAGARGESATPCPRLVLGRCAPHAGPRLDAPRAPGHAARAQGSGPSSAREAAEPSRAASGPSGQASGHRGPAPRSPGTGSARRRAWGEARAEEAEPQTWARPLARGRGGGGASECFPGGQLLLLGSCCLTFPTTVVSWVAGLPCCAETRVYPQRC